MRRIKFFENGEVIDDMIVDKEYYDENKKMTIFRSIRIILLISFYK